MFVAFVDILPCFLFIIVSDTSMKVSHFPFEIDAQSDPTTYRNDFGLGHLGTFPETPSPTQRQEQVENWHSTSEWLRVSLVRQSWPI